MEELKFTYHMRISYSQPASICHFTIKCIPKETARQTCLACQIHMDPSAAYTYGEDAFHNQKIIGAVREPHSHFLLDVEGSVRIRQILYEEAADPDQVAIYKYPTALTWPGAELQRVRSELFENGILTEGLTDYDKALALMHWLYKEMQYVPGSTTYATTTEEAYSAKHGVCQDYAHVFVTLCRLMKIPARYVTGMMLGEGESHAWAEFLWRNAWIGLDPTNDLLIDENYIKLSDGRDAHDCQINLGIIRGGGTQSQEVAVTVVKMEKCRK